MTALRWILWFLDEVCSRCCFCSSPSYQLRRSDHSIPLLDCVSPSQTHIVVTGVTALTFLWTRSTHVAYFIIGAMGCNVTGELV